RVARHHRAARSSPATDGYSRPAAHGCAVAAHRRWSGGPAPGPADRRFVTQVAQAGAPARERCAGGRAHEREQWAWSVKTARVTGRPIRTVTVTCQSPAMTLSPPA